MNNMNYEKKLDSIDNKINNMFKRRYPMKNNSNINTSKIDFEQTPTNIKKSVMFAEENE